MNNVNPLNLHGFSLVAHPFEAGNKKTFYFDIILQTDQTTLGVKVRNNFFLFKIERDTKGDYGQVFDDLDKAIQLNPKYAEAYSNRAKAWTKIGNYKKALADYDKAIQLNPKYAEAYSNRAAVLTKIGNYKKALADYDKAIQLNPNFFEAYNNRGFALFQKGDHRKALADYDKAIQLNPKYAEAYYNRATSWRQKGDYAQVFADLDKAIQLNPKYAEAYYNRGIMHSVLKQNKDAAQDFNHYLKIMGNRQGKAEDVREKIIRLGYIPDY